jgi:hypothetical protein
MDFPNPVELVVPEYDHEQFLTVAKGLEDVPEGGSRCCECFRLRLELTAKYAKQGGFDYFTTTLSISPHKNSKVLNTLGSELGQKYGVKYLYSDFKKKGGFGRSTVLSKKYDLYRQVYCGCEYSFGYPL